MIRSLPSILLGLLLSTTAVAAQDSTTTLTLVEAIRLGRQQGVSAALAQINHRVADSRQRQHRADLLPTISLSGSVSRQTNNLDEFGIPIASGVTDPFNIVKFSVRGSQTLFDASAITRLRAARDSAIASGLDARAVGDLSAATAGLAYLRALSAEETVRARESDSLVASSLLDQATKLVAAGVSPTIDQTRSEVNFAAVRTQLELARNQRDRTRLDLARALERSPSQSLVLVDSLAPAQLDIPRDPADAVAFALDHRADLVAERNRTKAIAGSLRSIGQEYIPSLGVTGGYNQSGQEFSTLKGTYLVQLGVTIPLLDGWRRPARQDEIKARLEGQQIRERDLALQVEIEARQSLLDLASAAQQVTLANDRVRLAEQELSQAEERFTAGVAGSIETTNGQGALVAARDALIQARVNYASARVSAYRALGVIDQLQ